MRKIDFRDFWSSVTFCLYNFAGDFEIIFIQNRKAWKKLYTRIYLQKRYLKSLIDYIFLRILFAQFTFRRICKARWVSNSQLLISFQAYKRLSKSQTLQIFQIIITILVQCLYYFNCGNEIVFRFSYVITTYFYFPSKW